MSSRFNMELPITLVAGDTASATEAIVGAVKNAGTQSEKSLKSAADKGAEAFKKSAEESAKSWSKTVDTFRRVDEGVQRFAARAQQAFQGLVGLVDVIQSKTDIEGRAKWFGATTADAEMLRKKLDDVKSGFEAMALASELKAGGLNSSDLSLFADAINNIAALSGEAKSSVEQALKAGELSDKMINVLGKSRAEIDAIVAKAQVAAGGRNLQPLERTQAILRALGPDLQKIGGQLGNIGRSNPFLVLQKDLQSIWEGVSVQLRPALDELVRVIQQNKGILVQFFSGAVKAVATFAGWIVKAVSYTQEFINLVSQDMRNFARSFHSAQREQDAKIGKLLDQRLAEAKAKQGLANAEKIKAAADTAKKVAQVQLSAAQKAANARAAQAKLEARQETISRMAEARSMIRNFQQLALEATASLGGPVSGALSAFKDSFEKFKVLGSLYRGTLTKLADASEDEIKRLREAGKITESQAKAVKLFQTYLRAGELDLREYLNNQRAVNVQLEAQGSLLQSNAAIAQNQIEQLNQRKEVTAAITSLQKTISLLEGKDDVVSRRKLGILRQTLTSYQQISTRRREILDLALATAKIDKQFEQIRSIRAMSREIEDVRVSTKQLSLELQALLSKEDTVLAAQVSAEQQRNQIIQARQEILRKYQDNLDTIAEKSAKLALPGQSKENVRILSAQVEKLKEINNELNEQAGNQSRIKTLTEALAKIDISSASRRQATERERAFQDIVVGRLQLQQQLLELGNSKEKERLGVLAAQLQIGQAKSQLERKMIDNTQRLEEIERKRKVLATKPEALAALDKEAKTLNAQNTELQKQITLQDQILKQQQRLFSVGGSMLKQLGDQAVDAAQKIGQAAASASMNLIGAMGGALSTLFEQLITADKDLARNFGKSILNALGDMAAAFASTFAAVSVGKFALGDFAGGAGLAAAAAALYIVAGSLKGAGALVGPQTPQKQTTSSTPTRTSLPGQEQTRRETVRETYVIVPSDMLGDQLRQARSLSRFIKESERRTLGSRRRLG